MEGKVAGISADDDELVIISHDARIFTLDRISDSPRQWNLSSLWGFPFWFAPGQRLPETWGERAHQCLRLLSASSTFRISILVRMW
ncbi:hypothetical protein [Corynebacterium argentoratense]|uniref:hypothetical protein n=1 Tax=Corynebacterium argentoratense TaxID=42817 RepID=UPI0028E2CF89|nr:hypothetical protein [Corynebacterium argentoratense]